jgi:hypothetical protein
MTPLFQGELHVGTPACPFQNSATITLTGNVSSTIDDIPVGAKVIAAGQGAVLELVGSKASQVSWTRLSATAKAGALSLSLEVSQQYQRQ